MSLRIATLVLFLVGALAATAFAATTHPMMMASPLVAPLFIEDDAFSSTISLVNAANVETYANLTVRSQTGRTIIKKRVALATYGERQIAVGDLLREANSAETHGSIVVEQSPDLQGMAVLAQLSIIYQKYSRPSYIDEEVAMPDSNGSQVLRGVARNWGKAPFVIVTSLSKSMQRIRIDCLTNRGTPFSKFVQLHPNATFITSACTRDSSRLQSFEDNSEQADNLRPEAVGIQLLSTGSPGAFAAFGLSRHRNAERLVFGAIPFEDPKMSVSASTVYTGVPVGTTKLLSSAKYRPFVAVANFSLRPAEVTVKYSRTSAHANSVTAASVVVKNVMVGANQATIVSLAELSGDPGMRNAFIVSSNAAPGNVFTNLASSNANEDFDEVELLGKDGRDLHNAGVHPWSILNGAESTLFLFNHTAKPGKIIFNIAHDRPLWQKTISLAPFETRAIEIRELIEDAVKDDRGRSLPRDLVDGQVNWSDTSPARTTGRLMLSNNASGMARNFSCAYYQVLCGAGVSPTTGNIQLGDTINFGGSYSGCVAYGAGSCSGSSGGSVSAQSAWSGGGGVLTYSCSGFTSCSMTGANPGLNVQVTYQATGTGCIFYANATVTVGCGDVRGNLIKQYKDNVVTDIVTGTRLSPTCSQFSQTAHSVYFTFSEINKPCPSQAVPQYTWALVKKPMAVAASSGYGMDSWRQHFGSSRIINSGYRDPTQNSSCGGVAGSRHEFGDAADLRNQSGTTTEWNQMVTAAHAANADFVELQTDKCGIACTHADWRKHDLGIYIP